jgi:hypothetical protein
MMVIATDYLVLYKSTGHDTGHYTAICKSKNSLDWFKYNDGDVRKSAFHKHNGGPKKSPYQRLVTILLYEETGISDSNNMLSTQAQTSMQSATTTVGHLPNAMLTDGKNIAALKDDESVSTLSTRDCSHDEAPSAAFNNGWTTFEEWNYTKRLFTRFQMICSTNDLQHLHQRGFYKVRIKRRIEWVQT